ncbi:MAG TPA: ring-cleaving dioxygenase [Saprospiraceae bacterium]|nr:ring-cleaving dioxygenase [Saprospiraceae bacterium]HMP22741.1 ring-cleaving dioxygenase [Saprospiraceae bacterium]
MATKLINGIHHVTALADDPQKNVDFYAGILGLRLVKKTINFDAPDVYHFYYGNEIGAPGTIMTFFPYAGIRRGRKGVGQLTVTSFSVPANSLGYWADRLKKFGLQPSAVQTRFDEAYLTFEDFDGLTIELVANDQDDRPPFTYGQIPEEHAVRGFYGVTLSEDSYERTALLLTDTMHHEKLGETGDRLRYSASGKPGDFVDILRLPQGQRGLGGGGTVHHLAFGTDNDDTQVTIRTKIAEQGLNVTPVLDRQYFHSIYFREPGGVLFEIATNPPGFLFDEGKDTLGTALKLPPWEEPNRPAIEAGLTPVEIRVNDFK